MNIRVLLGLALLLNAAAYIAILGTLRLSPADSTIAARIEGVRENRPASASPLNAVASPGAPFPQR